ncbi:hypothetical protein NDU88_011963 [Pleurodeles waltl]|uniref:Uncharacterized protein n=1 Tax=Pleurodeles waltl TaxID=8319 RepID=A0AAV7S5Y2_PLEWA|nr:hypothetical protein NDU88_011963 [Pleurodeles waltl]
MHRGILACERMGQNLEKRNEEEEASCLCGLPSNCGKPSLKIVVPVSVAKQWETLERGGVISSYGSVPRAMQRGTLACKRVGQNLGKETKRRRRHRSCGVSLPVFIKE